jgi:serine/threonine protein phosphatase PrpC
MFRFAARTDVGKRGGENQDAIGADPDHGMWFVADGMGGHAAGSVASAVVKSTLLEHAGAMALDLAILRAHEAVVANAAAEPNHTGMGSTVVAAQLTGSKCTIAWVGDSRAYLWHRGRLRAISRDHSLIEGLREQQGLSETQVREHPNRHMVTQTLGLGSPVPSHCELRLRARDSVLLCSDGLNDELTDAAIADVLRAHPTPEAAADALIAAALEHGGNDNVSVVLITYDGRGKGESATPLQARTVIVLSLVAGVTVALALAALWWALYGRH